MQIRSPVRVSTIPLAGPLVIFLLGALIGFFVSFNPLLSAPWLIWLALGTALYVAIVLFARTPARADRVAAGLVLVAALAGLVLAIQYRHLGFEPKFVMFALLGELTSALFPRFITASIDANAAATFLEGALPLAIALTMSQRGAARRVWAGCSLLIGYAVLLSASRGAWLALGTGAVFALLLVARSTTWRDILARLLPWLFGGALLVLALAVVLDSDTMRQLAAAVNERAADRLALYRNSLFLALDFPFTGIGPGATYGPIYSSFQLLILAEFIGYSHNLLLGIWLAQGVLGLVGFGSLLLASGRLIWRGLRAGLYTAVAPVLHGAAIGAVAVLLHGFTDAPQYDRAWMALLMIFGLLGLAVAAALLVDARPLTWVRLNRVRTAAVAAVLVAAIVLLWPSLYALGSANKAAVLQARSRLTPGLSPEQRLALHREALHTVERGLTLQPASAIALKRRGMLAMDEQDYGVAMVVLGQALRGLPADQSIWKALGYAYIWNGRVEQGVSLLVRLDQADEVREELDVWPIAWEERSRSDLAQYAREAAVLMRGR